MVKWDKGNIVQREIYKPRINKKQLIMDDNNNPKIEDDLFNLLPDFTKHDDLFKDMKSQYATTFKTIYVNGGFVLERSKLILEPCFAIALFHPIQKVRYFKKGTPAFLYLHFALDFIFYHLGDTTEYCVYQLEPDTTLEFDGVKLKKTFYPTDCGCKGTRVEL